MALATFRKCEAFRTWSLLTVTTAKVATAGQFKWEFYIVDGGEQIDEQLRKCDTISMHMAYRVQDTLSQTATALEASARTWYNHYGTKTESKPSWASVITALRETDLPEWVQLHEEAVVKAQLTKSQPISSEQSALLMQDFARQAVEAKIYVNKHGAYHMTFGVPADCVNGNDLIDDDVPVVFRYYTETHSCAAVCRSFSTSYRDTDF